MSTVVTTDDGARLHVETEGSRNAALTVLFAHGWTLSGRSWLPVARELRSSGPAADPDAVRLVRYDQRGHGGSGRGRGRPPSIDRLGLDMAQVIEQISPETPVLVAGHSMGGMTIMALAAARPELFGSRVVGATLVSTSAGGLRRPGRERIDTAVALGLRAPGLVDLLRRAYPPSRKGHLRAVRDSNFGPHATPQLVRETAEMIYATRSRTILEFYPALMAHEKHEQLAALAQIPVSIVVGQVDRLTSTRHAGRLADRIPGAELHVEPECGHMVLTERPSVVADKIRAQITTRA